MISTAERLFGPYEWERYDMLVLPPSFPYGGMENPRMTFLTPTVLAGDRSLVDVVYILKMREIYRHLSNAADRGDEAANIIGDIVVKTT